MAVNIQMNGANWGGTYTIATINSFAPKILSVGDRLNFSLKNGTYSQQLVQSNVFRHYGVTAQIPIRCIVSEIHIYYENSAGEKVYTGQQFSRAGWDEKTDYSYIPSAYSVLTSNSGYFYCGENNYVLISTLFNADNPNSPYVTLHYYLNSVYIDGHTSDGDIFSGGYHGGSFDNLVTTWIGTQTYTLNAPPSCIYTQVSDISTMSAWTRGKSIARTNITNANAQYGGNITNVKLVVGSSSSEITGTGTIDVPIVDFGEITPQVIVTDSRGQTTTYNLDPITVQDYNVPTISTFSIARENEHDVSGVAVSDIAFALTCRYTQMSDNALGTPSVKIDNTATQVAWYTDATRETPYPGTWTGASPLTLYGVVSGMYQIISDYNVSVTIADTFSTSEEKTEVLPTVFVTMDFQAGGKEIAFGDKADDSLTNHPNGLFKCAMDMTLRGTRVPSIFVSTNDPASNDGDDGDIWIKYEV